MARALLAGVFVSLLGSSVSWSQCGGGAIVDDGFLEDGINAADPVGAPVVQVAMRLDLPAGTLKTVCVYWGVFSFGTDRTIPFTINVWSIGAGNRPGTLVGRARNLSAEAVSITGRWLEVDVESFSIDISGPVFVGVEWDPDRPLESYLGVDQSGLGAPSFFGTSAGTAPTLRLGQPGARPDIHALGIRAAIGGGGECVPSSTTVCLAGDRFAVTVQYETTALQRGLGRADRFSDDTGYFWFFKPANIEAVVKVLDACGVNGAFWVFAGGLTDLKVDVIVRDAESGVQRSYVNPQSTNFLTVADTGAFSCSSQTPPAVNVAGSWETTFAEVLYASEQVGVVNDRAFFTLAQAGTSVSGTFRTSSGVTGDLTGHVVGNSVIVDIRQVDPCSGRFIGYFELIGSELVGTYTGFDCSIGVEVAVRARRQ
jgi:hypothetical protein